MKPLSPSAATVKSKPAKMPAPAAVQVDTLNSGKAKSALGTPEDKLSKQPSPVPLDDTRRVDWIACFVTDVSTICNDVKGQCEVEVEWSDDDAKSQASGLERGYGKTMQQAFRQAVDKGIMRCGW